MNSIYFFATSDGISICISFRWVFGRLALQIDSLKFNWWYLKTINNMIRCSAFLITIRLHRKQYLTRTQFYIAKLMHNFALCVHIKLILNSEWIFDKLSSAHQIQSLVWMVRRYIYIDGIPECFGKLKNGASRCPTKRNCQFQFVFNQFNRLPIWFYAIRFEESIKINIS